MQQRTLDDLLDDLLSANRDRSVVVHADSALPPRLASYPAAATATQADVAVGITDAASLDETVAALVRAVRAQGTVVVVANAPGWFGLGASRAPELSAVSEALLKAGVVELAAAITPGTLKKALLVWGTALED